VSLPTGSDLQGNRKYGRRLELLLLGPQIEGTTSWFFFGVFHMSTGNLLFKPLPHRLKGHHNTSPQLGRVTHKQAITLQGHEPCLIRVDPVL
jgi:hypothetical protein